VLPFRQICYDTPMCHDTQHLLQVPGVRSWRVACTSDGLQATSRQQNPKTKIAEVFIPLVTFVSDQLCQAQWILAPARDDREDSGPPSKASCESSRDYFERALCAMCLYMHRAQGEKKQLLLRRNGLTFFLVLRYHNGRKVWTNIRLILLAASADRLRQRASLDRPSC